MARADALVVGSPDHWGNMSAPLKLLFDRNVSVFIDERGRRVPAPRQSGKRAAIVTACATPWPLNSILLESRGTIRAVKKILKSGGYTIVGAKAMPGASIDSAPPARLLNKMMKLGKLLY
jgi:multimeric flavodoxin WrbA